MRASFLRSSSSSSADAAAAADSSLLFGLMLLLLLLVDLEQFDLRARVSRKRESRSSSMVGMVWEKKKCKAECVFRDGINRT